MYNVWNPMVGELLHVSKKLGTYIYIYRFMIHMPYMETKDSPGLV